MIRRLLCWLGLHKWEYWENVKKLNHCGIPYYVITGGGYTCKHCGKIKR